jgi:hypothetical protein
MKRVMAFTACVLAAFLVAATPKPAAQLQPLLTQLAQNPDDADLRKRIIQLVLGMPHAPSPSPEFQEQIGAASEAFKHAARPTDFQASIDAFKKASLLAPWVPNVYYDIAVADEKIQNYDDAIANLNWYLTAAPHAKDAGAIYQKIGALQYDKQQKVTADATATAVAQAQAAAQVAAAQIAARKQAVVDAVKRATSGITYEEGSCWGSATTQIEPGVTQNLGCNQHEYDGSNWHFRGFHDHFEFPTDGTITISGMEPPHQLYLRGTPSSNGSITWECPQLKWAAYPSFTVTGWSPAWFVRNSDWSGITFSCGRPEGMISSSARYHYTALRRSN